VVTGTAHDKLDLASPEAALRTFLTAYRQGDFITAFWVLSPQAQREWKKHLDLFMFDSLCLMRGAPTSAMRPLIEALVPPMDKWEQPEDVSFLFAHLMTVAQLVTARSRRAARRPINEQGSAARRAARYYRRA
jgi:hypothetical protein